MERKPKRSFAVLLCLCIVFVLLRELYREQALALILLFFVKSAINSYINPMKLVQLKLAQSNIKVKTFPPSGDTSKNCHAENIVANGLRLQITTAFGYVRSLVRYDL